jgi:predicted lipid-binding transport protein (Tim44 family)
MAKGKWAKTAVCIFTFLFVLCYVLELESWARVGGGTSSGSRGSRSYSSPSRPSPGPSQSVGTPTKPTPPSQQPIQQPGGGFFRNMLGGLAGGFLGAMLFRSLGWGGQGSGTEGSGTEGGGIGFMEIALIAVLLFLLYRFIKKRRQAATAGAYYQATEAAGSTYQQPSYGSGYDAAPAGTDTASGLRQIKQMDPYFDEQKFQDLCMDSFFKIQGAWTVRDLSSVRNLLTSEIYQTLQNDAERLKAEKKLNRLDNIAVRSVDITEAWQEQGKDYVTVHFYANLLDYVVDENSGQVLSGSKTDPVKFEEYWTFTRSVGNNAWQLSAITQPS